jgi:hypothetical protein
MMSQATDAAIDTGALLPGLVEYLSVGRVRADVNGQLYSVDASGNPVAFDAGGKPTIQNLTPTGTNPSAPAGGYVIKRANKVSTATTDNTATLVNAEMVQINITAVWSGWGRQRTRSATTVVSRWGISK